MGGVGEARQGREDCSLGKLRMSSLQLTVLRENSVSEVREIGRCRIMQHLVGHDKDFKILCKRKPLLKWWRLV